MIEVTSAAAGLRRHQYLADRNGWSRSHVPLRIRLGDLPLATIRLGLAVWSSRGTEPPLDRTAFPTLVRLLGAFPDGLMLELHPVVAPLPRFTSCQGSIIYVARQYRRYYIDLTTDFSAYAAKFSSKSRSTLRRKIRRLAAASGGTVDWRQYRTPEEMQTFHACARRVAATTYQERLFGGAIRDDTAFVDRMLELAGRDHVRGYLLFHNGKPISYLYCPARDGSVLMYNYLGYDPVFAEYSPGTVLQWCALEAIFGERRFEEFDFTEGEGEHKRFFSTGSRLCANIIVLPGHARNQGIVLAHSALERSIERCGFLLERLGLKSSLKRLMRRRA